MVIKETIYKLFESVKNLALLSTENNCKTVSWGEDKNSYKQFLKLFKFTHTVSKKIIVPNSNLCSIDIIGLEYH